MDSGKVVIGCVTFFVIFFVILVILAVIGGILSDYSYGEKVGVVVNKIYYAPYGITDESFSLELEKEINGEKRRVFIYVPEYIYKEYSIGDYYGGE